MIDIYNSLTARTNSTTQDLLNDLSTRYSEWYDVVYDTTVTTNVSELWVSEKIWLSLTTESTPKIKISHTNGTTNTASAVLTKFIIVTTDKGVMLSNNTLTGNSAIWLAIGKTVDPNGVSSHGVVIDLSSSSSNKYTYTDNMSLDTSFCFNASSSIGSSRVNTVLAPIYSGTGDESFDDLMIVLLSKDTDNGKVLLNDNYYYINEAIALPYTET